MQKHIEVEWRVVVHETDKEFLLKLKCIGYLQF